MRLETIGDARHLAVLHASKMRDHPTVIWAGEEFRVEVTNAYQLHFFTIIVFGFDAPAIPNGIVQLQFG